MDLDALAQEALTALPCEVRERFTSDPHGALEALGLSVVAIGSLEQQRRGGGACDGTSFLDDRVILYAPSPYSRRENFTLAHELGHFLADRSDTVLSVVADHCHPLELLEWVCDRIAQHLLMPAAAVEAVLTGLPVSASALLELYTSSSASRPVCAIALAQRLPCVGAFALIQDGEVAFASTRPDPHRGWPTVAPRRGDLIPPGHPLTILRPGRRLTRRSFWETSWGQRQPYYIDAVYDGRRIVAVLAEHDIWGCERLHLDRPPDFNDRPMRTVTCCGTTREVRGYPCPTCDGGYCPTCRQCRCQKAAAREQPCQRCFLTFAPHLLTGGLCEDCR